MGEGTCICMLGRGPAQCSAWGRVQQGSERGAGYQQIQGHDAAERVGHVGAVEVGKEAEELKELHVVAQRAIIEPTSPPPAPTPQPCRGGEARSHVLGRLRAEEQQRRLRRLSV